MQIFRWLVMLLLSSVNFILVIGGKNMVTEAMAPRIKVKKPLSKNL
jgi:hypothetical protein